MNCLNHKHQDNLSTLYKITEKYSSLKKIEHKIVNSYEEYFITKGSLSIKPIGLEDPQMITFKTKYKNRPQAFNLTWINNLYKNNLNYCPICGSGDARTIEHYLPKERYPEFYIYCCNLVPSCSACNAKRGSRNNNPNLPLLHPYFDHDLISRLSLEIKFDLGPYHEIFELDYNKIEFQEYEQSRIENHIEKCLDTIMFDNVMSGKFKGLTMEYLAYNDHEAFINNRIKISLWACENTGANNSWEAAMYRGLMKIDEATFRKHALQKY